MIFGINQNFLQVRMIVAQRYRSDLHVHVKKSISICIDDIVSRRFFVVGEKHNRASLLNYTKGILTLFEMNSV